MPVPTSCIAAIAATAINAAMSAYSMAVTPDPSLISFKKSARNRVILDLIRTHAQIADQNFKEFLNRTNEPGWRWPHGTVPGAAPLPIFPRSGREWYDAELCRSEALRQSRDGSLGCYHGRLP